MHRVATVFGLFQYLVQIERLHRPQLITRLLVKRLAFANNLNQITFFLLMVRVQVLIGHRRCHRVAQGQHLRRLKALLIGMILSSHIDSRCAGSDVLDRALSISIVARLP